MEGQLQETRGGGWLCTIIFISDVHCVWCDETL
jgi:hypothetical protein